MGLNYFYAPKGPIFNIKKKNDKNKVIVFLFEQIKKLSKREKCFFLRFEPQDKIDFLNIKKTIDVQPAVTVVLNLKKTKKELLTDMHQKTRYNINLAKKKEIKIIEGDNTDFMTFWNLMTETTKRDGFRLHAKSYYNNNT